MMRRMLPLNWELAPAGKRGGKLGFVLLLIGIMGAGWVLNTHADLTAQIDSWESKRSEQKYQSRRTAGVIGESPRERGELQQEIRIAQTVVDQFSVPWNELFRELEAANDGTVALLAVQPEIQNRTVRISGEAKNLAAMLTYAEKLQQTRMLSGVHVSEHRVKEQDAQKPIEFSMVALWAVKP